jgi:hypothetical protein
LSLFLFFLVFSLIWVSFFVVTAFDLLNNWGDTELDMSIPGLQTVQRYWAYSSTVIRRSRFSSRSSQRTTWSTTWRSPPLLTPPLRIRVLCIL